MNDEVVHRIQVEVNDAGTLLKENKGLARQKEYLMSRLIAATAVVDDFGNLILPK